MGVWALGAGLCVGGLGEFLRAKIFVQKETVDCVRVVCVSYAYITVYKFLQFCDARALCVWGLLLLLERDNYTDLFFPYSLQVGYILTQGEGDVYFTLVKFKENIYSFRKVLTYMFT